MRLANNKNIIKKIITFIVITVCSLSLVGCSSASTADNSSKSKNIKASSATVKKGDVVKIDFVGKVDGKEFDGGSTSDYVLEVGSGTFIDGFEDQLIGHKAKDTFDVSVVFPKDYGVDNLNGKEAVFKTSIQKVYKKSSATTAKKGDIVKIDFVGKVDGKEFDGGSSSDYVLEIGSRTFIDGFEDQLIGHKTKENFNVSVVFPKDYGVDNLNGKEAVFKTSIQKIYRETK